MSYYGRVVVEVRLERQGHGTDTSGEPGSGFGVHATRTVALEEHEAREWAASEEPAAGAKALASAKIKAAVKGVLDEDDMAELNERWREATRTRCGRRLRRSSGERACSGAAAGAVDRGDGRALSGRRARVNERERDRIVEAAINHDRQTLRELARYHSREYEEFLRYYAPSMLTPGERTLVERARAEAGWPQG